MFIQQEQNIELSNFRYATLLFKKQRYVSGQHKVNLKIICKENYKYEVQEKSPANQAVTVQQLAEEYWRFALEIFTIHHFINLLQDRQILFKSVSQPVLHFQHYLLDSVYLVDYCICSKKIF